MDHTMATTKIDERAAAAIIGMSVAFLRMGRLRGDGPPFYKFGGAVRYDVNELEQWMASRRRPRPLEQRGGRPRKSRPEGAAAA
jgi:hypothetical protein